MKQFRYNLETVLNYKNQVLDDLKTQHAVAADRVNKKQETINHMEGQLSEFQRSFDHTVQQGASIETLRLYGTCIDGARKRIEGEKEQLVTLEKKEKEKRKEVLTAKVDTSRYEKLRERRFVEYHKAVQKEEEKFAEEFIVRSIVYNMEKGASEE